MKIAKAYSMFLRRLYTIGEIVEVYKPPTIGSKLLDKLKGKYLDSDLPRKIQVAKGFYTLEMAPPTSRAELIQIKEEVALAKKFISSGGIKDLTVKQAWLLVLVCLEVSLWFYFGETLAKRHIVGYNV